MRKQLLKSLLRYSCLRCDLPDACLGRWVRDRSFRPLSPDLRDVVQPIRLQESGDQGVVKSPLEDAIRTQLVVDTIYRSLASQKPEHVPVYDAAQGIYEPF